jgi:hypothetical protein
MYDPIQPVHEPADATCAQTLQIPQDLQFAGALAGVGALLLVYSSLSGGSVFGSYGGEQGRPGVVERCEQHGHKGAGRARGHCSALSM